MEKKFNTKELEYFLNLLKTAKDENTIESYIYIKNILETIEFAMPFVIYPKGSKFVRSRLHLNNEEFFNKVSEISYREDIHNINRFGRANEPGQSIFYCCDNDWLSYVETSEVTRENIEKPFEYITTGLWIATEDIYAVNIISNETIRGYNKELDKLSKSFEEVIEKQGDENARILHRFLGYISNEFSKYADGDSNHYKITSAFTNYVFNGPAQADCILYPSCLEKSIGLNFAFKTSSVDKKLRFHVAMRRRMEFDRDRGYMETEQIDSQTNTKNDGLIIWKSI